MTAAAYLPIMKENPPHTTTRERTSLLTGTINPERTTRTRANQRGRACKISAGAGNGDRPNHSQKKPQNQKRDKAREGEQLHRLPNISEKFTAKGGNGEKSNQE